jgi:hypothetical protein
MGEMLVFLIEGQSFLHIPRLWAIFLMPEASPFSFAEAERAALKRCTPRSLSLLPSLGNIINKIVADDI